MKVQNNTHYALHLALTTAGEWKTVDFVMILSLVFMQKKLVFKENKIMNKLKKKKNSLL